MLNKPRSLIAVFLCLEDGYWPNRDLQRIYQQISVRFSRDLSYSLKSTQGTARTQYGKIFR
jgi:hypothetical protein